MFTVSKRSKNRVDIDISGSLSANEMRDGLGQLIDASKDVERGVMFYHISGFTMPTLGALSVELQKLPQLFGLLGKFDRCAVVSDQGWIRTAAEIEGAVIPGLDIKSFKPEETGAAEEWLAEA